MLTVRIRPSHGHHVVLERKREVERSGKQNFSLRSHHAGEIWKPSCSIFTVRFTGFIVHTHPSRKWRFFKSAFQIGIILNNTPALRFRVDGKHFHNEAFGKQWSHDDHESRFPFVESSPNSLKRPITGYDFIFPWRYFQIKYTIYIYFCFHFYT